MWIMNKLVYEKEIIKLTKLARESKETFWLGLRSALAKKSIDIYSILLVELVPGSDNLEFGVIVQLDGQSISFSYLFNSGETGEGEFTSWKYGALPEFDKNPGTRVANARAMLRDGLSLTE